MKFGILIILVCFVKSTLCRLGSSWDSLHSKRGLQEDQTSNQYIVVFKNAGTESLSVNAFATAHGVNVLSVYGGVFKGFMAELTAEQYDKMINDPAVKFVEPNNRMIFSESVESYLDTAVEKNNVVDTTSTTGRPVHFYILDGGVEYNHPEFEGRTGNGIDVFSSPITEVGYDNDCHGAGTHVAAIAAGTSVGVVKNAIIHSVKVVPCSRIGFADNFVNATEWVVANGQKPAVVIASIGTAKSDAINESFKTLHAAGYVVIGAAGNIDSNVKDFSPVSLDEVIVVGSTDSKKQMSTYSNYGEGIDILAPGEYIRSAWAGKQYKLISGTSQSAALVAGMAGQILSKDPQLTPAQVFAVLKACAEVDAVKKLKANTVNLLVDLECKRSSFGLTPAIPTEDTSKYSTTTTTTSSKKESFLDWLKRQGEENSGTQYKFHPIIFVLSFFVIMYREL